MLNVKRNERGLIESSGGSRLVPIELLVDGKRIKTQVESISKMNSFLQPYHSMN